MNLNERTFRFIKLIDNENWVKWDENAYLL